MDSLGLNHFEPRILQQTISRCSRGSMFIKNYDHLHTLPASLFPSVMPHPQFIGVSHRQSLLQFSSVIPSSSSPQMFTDEQISATSTAKQQRRAKMATHFCWLCGTTRDTHVMVYFTLVFLVRRGSKFLPMHKGEISRPLMLMSSVNAFD